MNNLTKVFSSSLIYAVSGILENCFSFFLLPLYTRYLTTTDYGISDLSKSFLSVMTYLAAFSLYSAINRYYVEYKSEPEKLRRFYGSVVVFVFLSCSLIFAVLTILRYPLSHYFFADIAYYPIILLTLLTLLFQCQFTIYASILRSQQKAMKVSILHIIWFFFRVSLTIFLVVVKHWGAGGVITATLSADAVYTLFFWWDALHSHQMVLCIDRELLKEALSYSIPIIPHNLSTHIATFISKVLIGNTDGALSSVGIYAIASNFGSFADTIHSYINQAYSPWMFERLHEKNGNHDEIRSIVRLLISASGFLLTGIALFSQDYITLFLEKSYEQAKIYSVLVVIVFILKTAYYYYVTILFYYKEASSKIFISTVSSSLLNLFLSFLLIPKWDVIGSIAADMIAMILRVAIIIIMTFRYEKKGLKLKDFVKNLVFSIIFIVIGMFPVYYFSIDGFNLKYFIFRIVVICIYFSYLLFDNKYNLYRYVSRNKGII